MESTKVSVILPVYKPNLYFLEEALVSIKKQHYLNLELIISIDSHFLASNIESTIRDVLGEFEYKLVYNQGLPGIFSNINYALKNSNADFVQLFSQDDIMYPDFIKRQAEVLAGMSEVVMVFSAFNVIDSSGKCIDHSVRFTFRPEQDYRIRTQEAHKVFIEFGCIPGNISPVMMRRAAMQSIGEFNTTMPYAGDFDYWVRLSRAGDIQYLHIPGLQVRKHDMQASKVLSNRQLFKDLVSVYQNLLEGIPQKEIQHAVHLINRKVGTAFIHEAYLDVLKRNSPLKALKERWLEMREFPFNPLLASAYYWLLFPSRLIQKLLK